MNIEILIDYLMLLKSTTKIPKVIKKSLITVDSGLLIVSTMDVPFEGHETAICDSDQPYPVERYPSVEAAVIGHEKWSDYIKAGNLEITDIGYGLTMKSKQITLRP